MRLAPDEIIGDGRYLLLAPFGGDDRAGMEFWHAHDGMRKRDVALTVLIGDPNDQAAVRATRHVLEGVRYAEGVVHPALAAVMDVPPPGRVAAHGEGVLGLVVAEWTEGVDLADGVLGTRPPIGPACRMLRPLVEAVDAAHRAGVVAGVDSPGRIRIAQDGPAVLAFRGTAPQTVTRDDIRGLGAVLYLLLTGSWPMADSQGRLVHPADLRPEVPRDLAMVAVLSLGAGHGPDIRTCGPLLRALDEAIAYADELTMFEPVGFDLPPEPEPEPEPAAASTASGPRQRRDWAAVARSALRGRRLAVALGTLAVALAVLIGTQVAGSFGVASTEATQAAATPPPTTARSTTPTSSAPATTTTTTSPPPPPRPVRPADVSEYVVSGSADNPGELGRVRDGDPGTRWPTATYRQQFPTYSPGIGILADFRRARSLAAVTIASPSVGTVVQIRAASSPDVSLPDAKVLATATLGDGRTTIPLRHHPTSRYLLVWITHLDGTAGGFHSEIGEITAQPAG